MKKILFVILVVLTSCSVQKEFHGLYGHCKNHYWTCFQLLLNEDGTFEYFEFYDVGGGNLRKGKWKKVDENSLTLNSEEQPKVEKTFFHAEIDSVKTDSIRIRISEGGYPLSKSDVFINNEEGKTANENGEVSFERMDIKSLRVQFLDVNDTIIFDNPKYNKVEITLRDIGSRAITNQKVYLGYRKLKFQKSILKKTKLKNKQWD